MDGIVENLVSVVKSLPNGRERSLAITKLEEAQFWAFKVSGVETCLACHGTGVICATCDEM